MILGLIGEKRCELAMGRRCAGCYADFVIRIPDNVAFCLVDGVTDMR